VRITRAWVVASIGLAGLTACSAAPPEATFDTARKATRNACPEVGCDVRIDEVMRAGAELRIRWTANFVPDIARNHIHVYWDSFTADQVSHDAEARGVKQGSWHPTADYPSYTTEREASVARRGRSTRICVTAGDHDHVVIDAVRYECVDVNDLL
jgi:hypothetical protein